MDKNILTLVLLFFITLTTISFYIISRFKRYMQVIKHNKQKLIKSQKHLQEIFDVTPNIMITTDGTFIDRANPAMLEFTGYRTLEKFKKEHNCICDLFIKEGNFIVQDMNGISWLDYIENRPKETHKVIMNKNGERHTFIVWAKVIEENHNTHSVVSFADITEQTKLEDELKASKEQFDLFMTNIPYVVNIKDEEYINIYTNRREFDYIGHYGLGRSIQEELEEKEATKVKTLLDRAKKSNKAQEVIKLNVESREYYMRLVAFTIPQPDSKIFMGLIYIDITKEYKNEHKLKEQEKIMITQSRHAAMGEMISMIAHQWRQPISVIAMDANNILADIELESIDESTLKETSLDIINQTQELSKTIDDFRNFFRPGKVAEDIFIRDVVEETFGVIEASLLNNNIQIIQKFSNKQKINTFSRELMQVLINILNNAKEALVANREKDRKIILSIETKNDKLHLNICDNAGGIDESIKDKIFDPYFSTKGDKNGTGLGLYMSKTIIEKHLNGLLHVKNKNDGVCFEIILTHIIKERET